MVAEVVISDVTEFETELVTIDELKPHPRNYNYHPDDQIEHLEQSIRENGVYRNIVVSADNVVLAGHGVVKAAKRVGLKHVPIKRINIPSDDPRALKILAGDNEIAHLSEKDDRLLSELLREIKELDVSGLLGTGFDDMMLANLVYVTRPQNEIEDFDEAAEWVGMPEYEQNPDTIKLIVQFENEDDRDEFARRLGYNITERTKSVWFPARRKDDPSSLRFDRDN